MEQLIQYARVAIRFDTQDGLFDVAWSEVHEAQLVVVKLFDANLNVRVVQATRGVLLSGQVDQRQG